MGANIFNMGLIGTFAGYYILRIVRNAIGRDKLSGMVAGSAIASWLSVVIAAAFCAVELAISETVPLNVALGAMVGWHIVIGIGEALITVATVSFVWRTRPDLLYRSPRKLTTPAPRSFSTR
jgi:cobalt/nickel transport system permease protein